MKDFKISKQQAKQFAFDCYDVIIKEIKENAEKSTDTDNKELNECA